MNFEVGDHVYVGDGGVHWEIMAIDPQLREATLKSGLTGRLMYDVDLHRLTQHSERKAA